jgi:hypothetical protein
MIGQVFISSNSEAKYTYKIGDAERNKIIFAKFIA